MKAKMKFLYKEGEAKLSKPFSFDVELRKWVCDHGDYEDIDYVIESSYTTGQKDTEGLGSVMGNSPWYKMVTTTAVVDAKTDGEAIRAAVDTYSKIKVWMKELDAFRNGLDGVVAEQEKTVEAVDSQENK